MKTTTQLTLLALLTAAASANAATVTFVGDGAGNRVDWETLAHWEEPVGTPATVLPDTADDVEIKANQRFKLTNNADITINSLNDLAGGNSSVMQNGKITVNQDVTLNQGLVMFGSSALEFGGTATADSFEFVHWTATHQTTSRVIGNNLTVTGGLLDFRWQTAGVEGSAVSTIDLSGSLTFNTGTILEIDLDNAQVDAAQTEGAYFLIGSETITGTLPSLLLTDWDADQATHSYLSIVNTGDVALQGVYLNVTSIPEPGTYALLAGCFALASVMIRRRR